MDIAPEVVVPPALSIAIALRVAFAQKGTWYGAMNMPASPLLMQRRRAREEGGTAALLRRQGG